MVRVLENLGQKKVLATRSSCSQRQFCPVLVFVGDRRSKQTLKSRDLKTPGMKVYGDEEHNFHSKRRLLKNRNEETKPGVKHPTF